MESNTYFGGKSGAGTYQTIINQIPPHRVYVELFGGMLGIYRHKRKAESTIIIEKDESLFDVYAQKFGIAKYNIGSTLALGRSKLTTGVRSYNGCALDVFNFDNGFSMLNGDDIFIYADPPFPAECRKSSTKYKNELTDEEHLDLLSTLISLSETKIALSTYPNDLYYEFFMGRNDWRFIEYETQTRRGGAIEQLWMNYPEPTELHDYQYLGKDYRERERIGRKLDRWAAKFLDLAPMEQAAMLYRLNNAQYSIAEMSEG